MIVEAVVRFVGVVDKFQKAKDMKQGQDSIIITLSQRTIKERKGGYGAIIKDWVSSNGDPLTWWYKCGNAPKHPERIAWVFWSIGGAIRWKCRLSHIEKDREVEFGHGVTMYAKNWLVLFDFEPIPKKYQISKKGFQGFRYADSETILNL